MSFLVSPFPQFVDDNGDPAAFYSVYFGQPNQDPKLFPKAPFAGFVGGVFVDPLPTTQTLDTKGMFSTDIFLDGNYSILIEDTSAVEFRQSVNFPNEEIEVAPVIVRQNFDSVDDLAGVAGEEEGVVAFLLAWTPGQDQGGGTLSWDSTRVKSDHDGFGVFSPTVPAPADFTEYDDVLGYINKDGETDPFGSGVWVRRELSKIADEKQYDARTGDSRTFRAGMIKDSVVTRAAAIARAEDLSDMVGFASFSNTTGGTGGTVFWVTNESDFETDVGSLRWAVAQVDDSAAAGMVLFDPRKQFEIILSKSIIVPLNCTIDAPANNAKIWSPTNITRFRIVAINNIVRRLSFGTINDTLSASEQDGIFVEATTSDRLWVDQCSFELCADGCIDIASLADVVTDCQVTVSKCLFRNHDKVMLVGSLVCYNPGAPAFCPLAIEETPTILVTTYKNWFDHSGQRHPKTFTKAFNHSVNNFFHISAKLRDDGTTGAVFGMLTATGGTVLSENDVFTQAFGTGASAIDAVTVPWVEGFDGPGASDFSGAVLKDGMTATAVDPGSVPTPPYTLIPDVISDVFSFADGIINGAGARLDASVEGTFIWEPDNTSNPDGAQVYAVYTATSGRYVRKDVKPLDRPIMTPLAEGEGTALITPRATTIDIAAGVVTLPDLLASYYAIDTEGAAATDDVDTIDGGVDGMHLFLRAASAARVPTLVDGTGNLALAGGTDFVMNLTRSTVHLLFDEVIDNWLEVGRSSN